MIIWRKYGVGAYVQGIPLIEKGTPDYKSNPTLASGDAKISKDGGAFANLGTLPDVEPDAGISVRITLSVADLTCKQAVILFVDQTSPKEWEDQCILIETYGNASAQHIFDLANATVGVPTLGD